MEYLEYKPNKHLSKYIECYWSAYSEKPPFQDRESLIPDGTIELMFNFGENYSQIIDDKKVEVKGSHIIGIRKQSLTISQTGRQNFFCVRFKLGGIYPFFKIPVNLFANAFCTIDELLGKDIKELEERLFDTNNNVARVLIADQYFLKRLNIGMTDYTLVENAVPTLHKSGDIKNVAEKFCTGYKSFERKFQRVLGLTPSELIKINRFNQAVLSMYSCKYNSLTDIGYACGYYDQSHFIREFKQLTDLTPKNFLHKQFTIVKIIQPALAERLSKSYNF